MDFDPVNGIPPGRDWESELYTALRRCDVVIAIDSMAWRKSRWCFAEVALARSLGKRVILLQIPGVRPARKGVPPPLHDTQTYQLDGSFEDPEDPLILELNRLGAGARRRFAWVPDRTPYPGLTPLQESDAGVLFGRDRDIIAVTALVEQVAKYHDKSIVLLIGPSGSGKSSLLRAGVLPQMRRRNWSVIGPSLARTDVPLPLQELGAPSADQRALFALDQLDEALLDSVGSDSALIRSIVELAQRHHHPAWMVATLRAEMLGVLNEQLGSLTRRVATYVVGPMTRADYRSIIEQPAEVARVSIEPSLIDALLADVGSPGTGSRPVNVIEGVEAIPADSLPMLAVTLRQLWDRRDPRLGLTYSSYLALGGLGGAIGRASDLVMAATQLDPATREAVRAAFVGMVRLDLAGRFTRQPLGLEGLSVGVRRVLERFVSAGLLVSGAMPGCIELAHESLVRTWPVLRSWVEAAREDLQRLQRFEIAVAHWRTHPEALLAGLNLAEAEKLAASGFDAACTADATKLLEESRRAQDLVLEQERQRAQAERFSESLRLAVESKQYLEAEPAASLRVAWEAVLYDRNEVSEDAFREALGRLPAPFHPLSHGQWLKVGTAGFFDDGGSVFVAIDDLRRIETWAHDGRRIGRVDLPGHGSYAVTAVPRRAELLVSCGGVVTRCDPVGRTLDALTLPGWAPDSSGYSRSTLKILRDGSGLFAEGRRAWLFQCGCEAGSLRLRRVLELFDADSPYCRADVVVVSEHDERFLVIPFSGDPACWSAEGRLLFVLPERGAVGSAAFGAGGVIATGDARGAGQIVDADGSVRRTFRPETGLDLFVRSIDRGGRHFVTASNAKDNALEVWSFDGEPPVVSDVNRGHYWSSDFSPDGRYLAAGCADGAVRVWEWRSGRLAFELRGHKGTVHAVAFHPVDGRSLLTLSHDGTARLWMLNAPILPALTAHSGGLRHMSRSGLGWLSIGSQDDTTRIWTAGCESAAMAGTLLATSRHGDMSVTVDRAGDVRVWQWQSGLSTAEPVRLICLATIPESAVCGEAVRDALLLPEARRLVLTYDTAGPRGAELWTFAAEHLATLVGRNAPHVDDSMRLVKVGAQPGSRAIATGAVNGMVWLWTVDGEPYGQFLVDHASPDRLLDMAFDPLGEHMLLGVRYRAGLWNWQGERVGELATRGYKVHRVAYSGSGQRMLTITGSEGGYAAELWDRQGRLLACLEAPHVSVTSQWYFDAEDRYLVLSSGSDLRLFDAAGEAVGVLGAARGVHLCDWAVSPDGDLIAAQFSDGMVRLWYHPRHRRISSIRTNSSGPIMFSVNGRRLLAATSGGNIEQYALDIADLFAGAAARLDGDFDPEEIRRFVIQKPPRFNLSRYRAGPLNGLMHDA